MDRQIDIYRAKLLSAFESVLCFVFDTLAVFFSLGEIYLVFVCSAWRLLVWALDFLGKLLFVGFLFFLGKFRRFYIAAAVAKVVPLGDVYTRLYFDISRSKNASGCWFLQTIFRKNCSLLYAWKALIFNKLEVGQAFVKWEN